MGEESACNAADTRDGGSTPGSGRSPWRRNWQPTPVFLPGESHGQRRLAGYSPKGCKESDMTERLSTHTFEWCWEVPRSENWKQSWSGSAVAGIPNSFCWRSCCQMMLFKFWGRITWLVRLHHLPPLPLVSTAGSDTRKGCGKLGNLLGGLS